MHNLEDMIEKYRQELVEFSKQMPQESAETVTSEKSETAVPVMASALPFVSNVGGDSETEMYKDYDEFEQKNKSQGSMRVQVTAGGRSFPIINAIVEIRVPLETGDREIFSGYTDINGIVDNINLPAPDSRISLDEDNTTVAPYAVYEVTVTHPEFAKSEFFNVPVFSGTKSIQPVRLVPLTKTGREPGTVSVPNQPMGLYGGEV